MLGMLIAVTLSSCVKQKATPITGFPSRTLVGLFILLFAMPIAWSQYPSNFYPNPSPGGYQSTGAVLSGTSPGTATFGGSLVTVWCGTNGKVQSMLQAGPMDHPEPVNTTAIPCTGGGAGRITVAQYGSKLYAIGQPLNNGNWNRFTMISSSDGINWTSYIANVTWNGYADGTFAQGFGLNTFTYGGVTYLALAYASMNAAGGGPSIALSTDGVNFTWKAQVSSNVFYSEPQSWDQSPSVFDWVVYGGSTNKLYVSYLTTGAYTVIAQSSDGVTWSSAVVTSSGLILNRDTILFWHQGALWYGGQSYYSADNLWLSGSYDGVNWGNAYNYGGIMSTSPSAVDFGGTFYAVWRACCSNYWWGNYSY